MRKKIVRIPFLILPLGLSSCSQFKYSSEVYCSLGDSITVGFDGVDHKTMKHPYPKIVSKSLHFKKMNNVAEGGLLLTNHSKEDCIARRYSQIPNNTSIISVMGGVNDYLNNAEIGQKNDDSIGTIYGATQFLISNIKNQFPNSYLFFMTPLKVLCKVGPNNIGYELVDYVDAIKDVCEENHVDVLDTYTICDVTDDFLQPNSDKLHPTQKFVREILSPIIIDFIKLHI